ncbi:unnamed protein product [Fraxinus pennsylvanica]|uniref:Inositol polyphosphate-related phosphatase domain-containing protein n=1 Tax=Fraxinus pennsylvanica TaxID=56036 RepID=A0AAD1YQK3_9LAMI|nr:unnamed protein product [Fraxinus pennsylvanica]
MKLLFWARVVMRKWLNLTNNNSDYSADTDSDSDSVFNSDPEALPWIRRKSETFRAQYINTKEIRRIIWLGDLNYRINLSYEKTRELISKKDWAKLVEHDQVCAAKGPRPRYPRVWKTNKKMGTISKSLKLVECTFADMEELGIRPTMSIVSMVGDVFEKLGMLDKCRKLKRKYPPPKWEYRYFKGKRVKVRAKYLEETGGNTDLNKANKEAEVNSSESHEDAEVISHELSDESSHFNVAEVYSTVPFENVDSKSE